MCRNGNPLLVSDLNKVSAEDARSIAVLANEEGDPDESDAKAVRIVLALCKGIKIRGHVVVEIRDIDNSELIHLVGDAKVEIIVSHDIIGRLMIQCARQPFLAQMYMKLLGTFLSFNIFLSFSIPITSRRISLPPCPLPSPSSSAPCIVP